MRKIALMLTRRLLLALLALLVAVTLSATGLSGCDTSNTEGWKTKPEFPSLPAVLREVSVEGVAATCGSYMHRTTHGCVWRDYSTGLCYVFHGPGLPIWLLQHEITHCAGFEHG